MGGGACGCSFWLRDKVDPGSPGERPDLGREGFGADAIGPGSGAAEAIGCAIAIPDGEGRLGRPVPAYGGKVWLAKPSQAVCGGVPCLGIVRATPA